MCLMIAFLPYNVLKLNLWLHTSFNVGTLWLIMCLMKSLLGGQDKRVTIN